MEIIFEDNKKRQIIGREEISLPVKTSGLYFLEVSARVKGEKQLGSSDDEDLRVEINGKKFSALNNSSRYLDTPAAFSGGQLKNLLKTVYFFLEFAMGEQTVTLVSDRSATFEGIKVTKLDLTTDGTAELSLESQAEDGDRRPWITFALINLALQNFSLDLNLKRRFIDSDDVKIIVDGKIARNNRSLFHKFWYFIASILTGEEQKAIFPTNLSVGLHYVELWADRMPMLHNTKFAFGNRGREIQQYQDVKFGRNYNRFDNFIFESVSFWNDFFSKQDYPVPVPLDSNLVKAIIYRESRLGYFQDKDIIDVMQVWDPENPARSAILGETTANEFINSKKIGHMKYSYPPDQIPPKVETPEESIFWGVRWLFHKAQYLLQENDGTLVIPYERKWRSWEEAVQAYNGNPKLVDSYLKEVFSVYEKGVDSENNKLW